MKVISPQLSLLFLFINRVSLYFLKYVEFGGMEDNESSETVGINSLGLALPSPNPSTSTSQQQQNSLETLLATKNKRIMEELTKLRVRCYMLAHSKP